MVLVGLWGWSCELVVKEKNRNRLEGSGVGWWVGLTVGEWLVKEN